MNTARHVLNCLALLPALACVHNADGQLPAVSPVFTMSLPGFPGADGHDAVAACGDDIVYVRFSDRSVRLLRQNAEGSWNESAFPNQGSAVGTDFTRVYGSGDLLAVVYNRVNASRAEIHRRSPKGSWSLVQTISAPTSSTFVNLHQAVWSGTSLMLVDRYADSYRGAAFIFQQNQLGQWVQEAKLQGSAASPFYTEVWSAQLDGGKAVLGHWLNTCGYGAVSGRAYVFERSAAGTWSESVSFRPTTAVCADGFAANVAIAGDYMYASAPNSGRVYRMRRQAGGWSQVADVPLPSIGNVVQGSRLLATEWGLISRCVDSRLVLVQKSGTGMLPAAILTPNLLQTSDCYCWNISLSRDRIVTITGSNSGTQLAVFEAAKFVDCDSDGMSNADEILAGSSDQNGDGIPDSCQCAEFPSLPGCCSADVILNGFVDGADLGALLTVWGTDGGIYPRADTNGDGLVDGADLAVVLSSWGACP